MRLLAVRNQRLPIFKTNKAIIFNLAPLEGPAKDRLFWHIFIEYQTYSNRFSSNVEQALASNIHTTNDAGLAQDLWRSLIITFLWP